MRAQPAGGTEAFYRRLLGVHGAYARPGHWFEMPDTCFRLGYGWSSRDDLAAGLDAISRALRG
jgi:DNA-binding transcriptional MocR family regulator